MSVAAGEQAQSGLVARESAGYVLLPSGGSNSWLREPSCDSNALAGAGGLVEAVEPGPWPPVRCEASPMKNRRSPKLSVWDPGYRGRDGLLTAALKNTGRCASASLDSVMYPLKSTF